MRQILASLAFAAAAALNVAIVVQPVPVQAQVRLPALGEAEGDEISLSEERKVGDQIMREIYADPDVIDDPVEFAYVDTIFERLLAASDRRGNISPEMKESFAWTPFLVKDKSFNAFALPGGYIGVHLGLIASAGNRDELASVLGHELSHITQRHIARAAAANKRQTIPTLIAMVLGLVATAKSGSTDLPMAILTSGQAAMATNQLSFSREMEREADRFGLDVMTDAGYAPAGMASMFERLDLAMRINDTNQYPWLRNHPLTIERISEARLRARSVAPEDPRDAHLAEHALMRARARALVDPSDPSLRNMQHLARLEDPQTDVERIGALYGGALASVELRDFDAAHVFLAHAQQVMDAHAQAASAWAAAHPAEAAAPKVRATAAGVSSLPSYADLLAPVAASAGAGPGTPPAIWPFEPEVARDFKLLRLQAAVAQQSVHEIEAAEAVLVEDGTRPTVLAHAQAAMGRWLAHDPQATVALRRQTEALQTWVALHPKDSYAWTLLSQCAEPLGQKLRAIRAEAESHAARGDVFGALDRMRAGQRAAREPNADFVEASIIDTRTRELEVQRRDLIKEFGDPNR
ncbi:MAG TPA: M48 family metalloprotease [Burkholderiaceae bacterium]|nr:M48 family metalloprotease [Burkholderiaceae bacterium]